MLIFCGIGGVVLLIFVGIYFSGQKGTGQPNPSDNKPSQTQNQENNGEIGSISDNPKYFSATEKAPSCDLEKWLIETLQPSIDKIFEKSKFVSAGDCDSIPLSGSKFVTKKLLSSVGGSSDAKDLYNLLVDSTGLSTDNSPMDIGYRTEMSFVELYGQQKILLGLTFNFDTQEIEIKVVPFTE